MSENVTIQISIDTLDELKAIGKKSNDYNKVIKMLIAEHNCNQLIEEGEKLIREHRDEFVDIDDLKVLIHPTVLDKVRQKEESK